VSKKTAWYPADVVPAHIGLYEVNRKYIGSSDPKKIVLHMLKWDGRYWRYAYRFAGAISGDRAVMSTALGDKWRGLTAPK
jgi:hypothetical protein